MSNLIFRVQIPVLIICECLPSYCQTIEFELVSTFLNPRPTHKGNFGARLNLLSESEVVIGARGFDSEIADVGAAYLYDIISATLVRTFENPFPGIGDNFGLHVVGVEPDLIVIGSHLDDTFGRDTGVVHVFHKETGKLLRTIQSPHTTNHGQFGEHIAAVNDNILIGAPGDAVQGIPGGAAYLFDPGTGCILQTFTNPSGKPGDQFGWWSAGNERTVVISARGNDTGALDAGIAYIFDISMGELTHTLENPFPTDDAIFGNGLTIVGNKTIIGAPRNDRDGTNTGGAYVFDLSTGELLREILSPSKRNFGQFGIIAVEYGEWVILTDSGTATTDLTGKSFLIDPESGNLIHEFPNPAPDADDYFGIGASGRGEFVVLGAWADDRGAFDSGAVHVFKTLFPPPATATPAPSDTPTPLFEGVVAGFIVSASDLSIIDEAFISVGSGFSNTAENGRFIIEEVPKGPITLTVLSPGFEPFVRMVLVEDITPILIEMDPQGTNPNADFNFDGIVNQLDIFEILKNWQLEFPGRKVTDPGNPDPERRQMLLEELQMWLESGS